MTDKLSFGAVLARLRRSLPEWILQNAFVTTRDGVLAESDDPMVPDRLKEVAPEDALLIAARRNGGVYRDRYALLLDVDLPVHKSASTNGNTHLFFDVRLTKEQHDEVLEVLAKAGIIQRGYANSGINSKFGSTLRLPWVRKGVDRTLRAELDPPTPY